VFNATSQTIVSDDEISTKNLLGTKSLRWNEISRVSGRGYAIKLHNSDGDITVAPNPQLPGYEDVVERIGMKHPNLFDPQEYGEMSKSWTGVITLPLVGILFIGFGLFIFTQADNIFFPLLMLSVIGIVFIGTPLTSPQAVTIQGDSITIGYLFRQKTLLAKEITSIDLRYTQTRNGKNYFVVVTPVSGGAIRLSGLRPNLPVTFLVLRNWHGKNTQIGQTNQQN
jgi:hypothetical protein